MDVMDTIIQIVERGEDQDGLLGAPWDTPKSSVQPKEGIRTTAESPTDGPAQPKSSQDIDWVTEGQANTTSPIPSAETISSKQLQQIPYAAPEISSSDTQLVPSQPLTMYSASTSDPTIVPTTTSQTTTDTSTTSTTSTASTTSTTTTDNTDTSNSLTSTQTKLAIALPVAIVGLLIIAALLFFFLRRRRRRNAPPAYDRGTGISTSELMAAQKLEASGPETSSVSHHLPVINVAQNQSRELSPGSATASGGMNDSHTELGLAVAVPMNQRFSASQHDLPRFSGSASRTSTPRMPFENRDGDDDDDDVSVVSANDRRNREHDFDDMSSVSSFEDDEHRANDHGRSR